MEEKKTKIIGIVIGIIIAIIIIAIGTAIFFTIRGNKKDNKKEAQAETPEVISGSSKKVTAGNTTLNSIDVSSSSKSKKNETEKLPTAATTWLSVNELIKIPIAINDEAKSSIPITFPKKIIISGVAPKKKNIKLYNAIITIKTQK